MLSNAAVKAARPKSRAYKIYDERGLHLYVASTGARCFRLRFRFAGTEQLLTIGAWPEVTLDAARARADAAREQLGRGEDPRTCPLAQPEQVRAFEYAARAWYQHRLADWTPIHAADVLASLERDVFPMIGTMALEEIRAPAIVALLRAIEARGSVATARRVQQRIAKVFALACSEGWTDINPAAGVTEALARSRPPRRQPALVDVAQLRALLAAVDAIAGGSVVALASWFLALTAVRLAAVRGATWAEIEDLDGDAPTWRIPAARMKLAVAKKRDEANDHLVPLSAGAVAVLQAIVANSHCGDADLHGDALIFAGPRGAPIGEGAIGALYKRADFAGRHVPHGWRASFSTILNERLPAERSAIDRALGHVGGGRVEEELGINRKVEGAYNRAVHLDRRRRLFDAWATILLDRPTAAAA